MQKDTVLATVPLLGELNVREWHAFVEGVYCGAEDTERSDYMDERHYWRAGFLLGKQFLRS